MAELAPKMLGQLFEFPWILTREKKKSQTFYFHSNSIGKSHPSFCVPVVIQFYGSIISPHANIPTHNIFTYLLLLTESELLPMLILLLLRILLYIPRRRIAGM